MKVFIAAKFEEAPKAREVAVQLEMRGHEVTSSWLREQFEGDTDTPWVKQVTAAMDLYDVERSDALVLLTDFELPMSGAHVETGIALALHIPVYILGPRINVYHFLPEVKDFEELEPGVVVGQYPLWGRHDWQDGDVKVEYGVSN